MEHKKESMYANVAKKGNGAKNVSISKDAHNAKNPVVTTNESNADNTDVTDIKDLKDLNLSDDFLFAKVMCDCEVQEGAGANPRHPHRQGGNTPVPKGYRLKLRQQGHTA